MEMLFTLTQSLVWSKHLNLMVGLGGNSGLFWIEDEVQSSQQSTQVKDHLQNTLLLMACLNTKCLNTFIFNI